MMTRKNALATVGIMALVAALGILSVAQADGPSVQQAQLSASDGAVQDQFGISVAISGDTAVVGAYGDTVGGNAQQGSAYVYVRSGATWTEQAKLTAPDGAAGERFGISVAVSGDTAVVGSYRNPAGGNKQGAAYVYVRSGITWPLQQKLTASDGTENDFLGWSVAISGDTAVVGAYQDNLGQGSAYVYVRSGVAWTQQAKLTASDGAANDRLGYSVAISGDTAVVGAYQDEVGAISNQGSAYVYLRSGATWTEQAKLTASDGAASDYFGISVGISGDTAVAGAKYDDIGFSTDVGSVTVFVRSGATWTQQAKLTASGAGKDDNFGISVAISGDTAVGGAPYDQYGGFLYRGTAFVFAPAALEPTPTPTPTFTPVPSTPTPEPTATPTPTPTPTPVPGITSWGLLFLAVAIIATAYLRLRRHPA